MEEGACAWAWDMLLWGADREGFCPCGFCLGCLGPCEPTSGRHPGSFSSERGSRGLFSTSPISPLSATHSSTCSVTKLHLGPAVQHSPSE